MAITFNDHDLRTKLGEDVAATFRKAVQDAGTEDLGDLIVRYGVWTEGTEGTKVVCKIQRSKLDDARDLPWSWWSKLTPVKEPARLEAELREALRQRKRRLELHVQNQRAEAERIRREMKRDAPFGKRFGKAFVDVSRRVVNELLAQEDLRSPRIRFDVGAVEGEKTTFICRIRAIGVTWGCTPWSWHSLPLEHLAELRQQLEKALEDRRNTRR